MISTLVELADTVDAHGGRARLVLEYTLEMKRVVDRAKQPGFDVADWDPLARFVATDTFRRVGPFKDEMDWPGYVSFLTAWAPRRHWECSFRRVTESGNLVVLELEERSEPGNPAAAANSVSVYEFDSADKICSLDVYLQMSPPANPA